MDKKVLTSFLVALFMLPMMLFAQSGAGTLSLSDINGPVIKWDKESFDFGEIERNVPVTVQFELTNTGKAPLLIQKVEASCGCTTADYKKAPIMPGEKTSVGATFDAKALGKFSKSLTVTTNDGNRPYTLRFSGTVLEK